MSDSDILLVEDNADDEALTLRALHKSRLPTPTVVRDGVEALAYLFGQGPFAGRDTRRQPRVILLDLKLPKLNGLEVLSQIRADERTRLVRVVVLTSSGEVQDIQSSYALGADSYVRKAMDFETYIETVGLLGRYWTQVNEPPVTYAERL